MKAISVHVIEDDYQRFKRLSALRGRPVAELIREAMADFLRKEKPVGRSLLDIPAHESGEMLSDWTRDEIYDEIYNR